MTQVARKIIDFQKIKETFKTMDYGQNVNSTAKADEWLRSANIVEQFSEIENILQNIKQKPWPCTAKEKKLVMLKFAQEIEKNLEILCQIEIQARGILSKDTKKYVPLLVSYLQYYANFFVLVDGDRPIVTTVAAVFNNDTPLWMLALVLGPALAADHHIVLQTGTKFAAATKFILDLAKKVGIPEHRINLISSDEGNLETYMDSKNLNILACFVDLLDPKYNVIDKSLTKKIYFTSHTTPMIVFDNGDVDSAVESVIDSAWGYGGMQPWAVNKILIQENIFQKFTAKLKNKLGSIKIGNGNNKFADISFPCNPLISSTLKAAVEKAKSLGVEVFQAEENSMNFTPTLLIGMNIETNNVIKGQEKNGAVTLLSFRSIDEAVNLSNNSRQGFGASIWTENIGLANEVANKLDVSNVWINSHGLISAEAPICPIKDSGNGYFGGREGFNEYVESPSSRSLMDITANNPDEAIINAINSAKTANISWSKITYLDRLKLLSTIFDNLNNLQNECLDSYIQALDAAIYRRFNLACLSPYGGYNLTSIRRPKGVIVIGFNEKATNLILNAILEGNAVILLLEPKSNVILEKVFLEMVKKLPSGVVSVHTCTNDAITSAISHRAVNVIYSAKRPDLPLKESVKHYSKIIFNWEEACSKATFIKNVWSNIGQSITCNL